MTSLLYKIGAVAMVVMATGLTGYMAGRNHGREATLKAAVQAYQSRDKINDKVQNMDGASLCVALGGVQHECAALMRGVDKAAGD